jgi:hypothetical protein
MYTGWIKCSQEFQRLIGFKFNGKHFRRNTLHKFFNCELTDKQYIKMYLKWKSFNEDIQWHVKKKVTNAHGINEGEMLASILSGKRYFFERYNDLYHESKLQEWTDGYGGRERYVDERYAALKAHLRSDGTIYSEKREVIWSGDNKNFRENDIDAYIKDLELIKSKLKEFSQK